MNVRQESLDDRIAFLHQECEFYSEDSEKDLRQFVEKLNMDRPFIAVTEKGFFRATWGRPTRGNTFNITFHGGDTGLGICFDDDQSELMIDASLEGLHTRLTEWLEDNPHHH